MLMLGPDTLVLASKALLTIRGQVEPYGEVINVTFGVMSADADACFDRSSWPFLKLLSEALEIASRVDKVVMKSDVATFQFAFFLVLHKLLCEAVENANK